MLPDFIIAGTAKSGTTSLYYYLMQHPEVDIPRKESFYFAREFYKNAPGDGPPFFRNKSRIIFTEDAYEEFYMHCTKKAVGEVSTCYAYFYENAIPLIKKKLGDVKIVFILRNPVERTFSAYRHFARLKAEPLAFKEALQAEQSRMEKKWDFMWYYTDVGFYAKQVKAYKENFSNVKVFLTDDLASQPQQVMKELFQFIGVDDSFVADTSFRYNASNTHYSSWFNFFYGNSLLNKFLKPVIKKIIPEKKRFAVKQHLRKRGKRTTPLPDNEVKSALINLYRNDITSLEKIINRDLSDWLK